MPVKKIIIIGSSSGLGKELAILYAQQNHMVCVTGRRHELLEELKTKHPSNIFFKFSGFDGKTFSIITHKCFTGTVGWRPAITT